MVVPEEPKQYDVPFDNVPAANIIMYEVNLWALSPQGNLDGVKARLDNLKALECECRVVDADLRDR